MNIILVLLLILFILFLNDFYYNKEKFNEIEEREIEVNTNEIPFVIICWNNLFFVKNFVNQIKKYKRKIIILNNNSEYESLYKYFKEVKDELGDQIEIRLLDQNYGHEVYIKLAKTLPDVYMLSDPDLQLNENLPENFVDILYNLSNKYKTYKVGFALDISDKDNFLSCEEYTDSKSIYDWEKQFWVNKINNKNYELYNADIDTTFCLINKNYFNENHYEAIRIAGDYTAKHLPWYKDYIKNNIPKDEIEIWRKNNKSSSLLFSCIHE